MIYNIIKDHWSNKDIWKWLSQTIKPNRHLSLLAFADKTIQQESEYQSTSIHWDSLIVTYLVCFCDFTLRMYMLYINLAEMYPEGGY